MLLRNLNSNKTHATHYKVKKNNNGNWLSSDIMLWFLHCIQLKLMFEISILFPNEFHLSFNKSIGQFWYHVRFDMTASIHVSCDSILDLCSKVNALHFYAIHAHIDRCQSNNCSFSNGHGPFFKTDISNTFFYRNQMHKYMCLLICNSICTL